MVLDLEDPGMRLMRLGTRALFDERSSRSTKACSESAR